MRMMREEFRDSASKGGDGQSWWVSVDLSLGRRDGGPNLQPPPHPVPCSHPAHRPLLASNWGRTMEEFT